MTRRACPACNAQAWTGQDEPKLVDKSEQILDPQTAYQITAMLEGVVQRGTATVLKGLDRPIAGKTGTTNNSKDVWFIGYSPTLVAGVYIGYDTPRSLGRTATGGHVCAPVFGEFMKAALAGQLPEPFRAPPGIKFIAVSPTTGERSSDSRTALLEPFKFGTAPTENSGKYPNGASSRLQEIVTGTGELY